jgi:GT2 family glycosyltransferase
MFYASGAGVLIRTTILEKIGGLFNSIYFMYHEDLDLCWRSRLAGYDIALAQDSIIFHRYEFSKSIKKFYWMERNRHLTNLACYRWRTLLCLAPLYLIMELGTLLFAMRSGWGKEKMRSWAHLFKLSTWQWIRHRRKRINGFRKISDRKLLNHVTGVILNQEVEQPFLTNVVNPVCQAYLDLLKKVVSW